MQNIYIAICNKKKQPYLCFLTIQEACSCLLSFLPLPRTPDSQAATILLSFRKQGIQSLSLEI